MIFSSRCRCASKLCFLHFLTTFASVNGFGGDVNSLLMYGKEFVAQRSGCLFCRGQWTAAVRLLFFQCLTTTSLYFDERQMFSAFSKAFTCNFCLFLFGLAQQNKPRIVEQSHLIDFLFIIT